MKRWVFLLLAVFLLMGRANAAEVPRDLIKALPEGTEDLIELADPTDPGGLARGVGRILEDMKGKVGEVLRQRTRGATSVLLVVVLCAAVEGFSQGTGGKTALFLPTEDVAWLDYETGEPFDLTAPITRDRAVVKTDQSVDESPME